ncbi:MAG: shikimate dehydrogenase, partial [Actinomycetota bacterium]
MRAATGSFAGVLGWPLAHTLSPAIHNHAFRSLGLDWVYLRWPVSPESLEPAVAGLRALGASGANVTMPHKETIVGLLDDVTDEARTLGAVNTVARVGETLVGHNTDVGGFSQFLAGDAGWRTEGNEVLVLGAGGAARAVVKALADLGAARILISARRAERVDDLMEIVRHADGATGAGSVKWDEAAAAVEKADLVVNTTPVGMGGESLLPDARFRREQCVVDLVYRPPTTPFTARARSEGADAWGGLGMLVHQAAESFRIWTGHEPPIEVMSAAA